MVVELNSNPKNISKRNVVTRELKPKQMKKLCEIKFKIIYDLFY